MYLFATTADIFGNWVLGNWSNPDHAGNGVGVFLAQSPARLERNTIKGNASQPPGTGWATEGGGVYVYCSESVP